MNERLKQEAERFDNEEAERMFDYEHKTIGEIIQAAFIRGYQFALTDVKTEAVRMQYSSVRPYDLNDLVDYIDGLSETT